MSQNTIKSLVEVLSLHSKGFRGDAGDYIVSFTLQEYGCVFTVSDVLVSDTEISLYSDKGILCYMVDNYNGRLVYELYDWIN